MEVVELIEYYYGYGRTGDWVERPLTLKVGACPQRLLTVFCNNPPSDRSHIVWLIYKLKKEPIHLGLSVGDRHAWRWVYGEKNRGIEPATSEEAKELKEEYGDADLSRFVKDACPTPR